jgi:hypothetical protein
MNKTVPDRFLRGVANSMISLQSSRRKTYAVYLQLSHNRIASEKAQTPIWSSTGWLNGCAARVRPARRLSAPAEACGTLSDLTALTAYRTAGAVVDL